MLQFQNKKIAKNDWDKFLQTNPYASPLQSFDFLEFINKTKNYEAISFSCSESNQLKAICLVTIVKESGLKGFFSRRAIIYGGPLLSDHTEINTQLLKYVVKELKNKVIYIEIRNFFDYSNQISTFTKTNWDFVPYLNVQLVLKDATSEQILSGMNSTRRRQIKQSLKEGASYCEASTEEEIKQLYEILKDLYNTRVKLPLPDLDYFINLFNSPVGKVFIVKHNNLLVGGAFCMYYENQSIYSLYYCGLRDYDKRVYPTHLALLGAIEFGINNKLKSIDFMGAGKPGEEYGVRVYKQGFGGELVEHGRFLKITKPFLFNLGKFALNQLKRFKK